MLKKKLIADLVHLGIPIKNNCISRSKILAALKKVSALTGTDKVNFENVLTHLKDFDSNVLHNLNNMDSEKLQEIQTTLYNDATLQKKLVELADFIHIIQAPSIQASVALAAGEMTKQDIEKGGSFYYERLELENICKKAGIKCTVTPFDVYQGPFAQLTNGGKLWFGEQRGDYYYEGPGGNKELKQNKMIKYLKDMGFGKEPRLVYTNPKTPAPGNKPKPNLRLIKSVLEMLVKKKKLK